MSQDKKHTIKSLLPVERGFGFTTLKPGLNEVDGEVLQKLQASDDFKGLIERSKMILHTDGVAQQAVPSPDNTAQVDDLQKQVEALQVSEAKAQERAYNLARAMGKEPNELGEDGWNGLADLLESMPGNLEQVIQQAKMAGDLEQKNHSLAKSLTEKTKEAEVLAGSLEILGKATLKLFGHKASAYSSKPEKVAELAAELEQAQLAAPAEE